MARPGRSSLGDSSGASRVESHHPRVVGTTCDLPVRTTAQADALAHAILEERQMSFITGRALVGGNPALKPGILVDMQAHDRRFDGRYYLTGVRHRYRHSPGPGYLTEVSFRRDASGDPRAEKPAPAAVPAGAAKKQSRSQPAPRSDSWVEVRLVGEDGAPVAGARFRLQLPDGEVREGTLDDSGAARVQGLDRGNCQLTFPELDEEAWTHA